MKKNYLLVTGLAVMTLTANAQLREEHRFLPIEKNVERNTIRTLSNDDRDAGAVLATDDFSDAANWIIYTEDGTAAEWEIVLTEPAGITPYISNMESTTEANGFGLFNGVQYLIAGTVTPQNALIEYGTSINCTGTTSIILEFEQAYRAFNFEQTIVEVTKNDWTDFESYTLNEDAIGNGPTYQGPIAINISSVAAGESNVRVRFRWIESSGDPGAGSGYAWMIDDLTVREGWNYDQRITASYHRSGLDVWSASGLEYYRIPTSQLVPIHFSALTESMAGLTQPNAKMNVEISGAESFSTSSVGVDLLPAAADSFSCETTFTPSTIGTYNVKYFVDCDNPEDLTSNDTVYDSFEVTGPAQLHSYARDNGIPSGSISNVTSNTGQPLMIGNVMNVFNEDIIGAIEIFVSSAETNVDQLIFAQVMLLDESSGDFVYFDQTDDHIIDDSENGGGIRLYFETPLVIPANSIILVLAGHYGGTEEVEFRTAQTVDEQSVLGFASGETSPFFLSSPSAIMVRPLMHSFVGIDDEEVLNLVIGQNVPNPFNETTVISYELNESSDLNFEIMDATGRIVYTENYQNQSEGQHTITLNANQFAEGIYFYTFKIGSQTFTNRMIVN